MFYHTLGTRAIVCRRSGKNRKQLPSVSGRRGDKNRNVRTHFSTHIHTRKTPDLANLPRGWKRLKPAGLNSIGAPSILRLWSSCSTRIPPSWDQTPGAPPGGLLGAHMDVLETILISGVGVKAKWGGGGLQRLENFFFFACFRNETYFPLRYFGSSLYATRFKINTTTARRNNAAQSRAFIAAKLPSVMAASVNSELGSCLHAIYFLQYLPAAHSQIAASSLLLFLYHAH